MISDDAIAWSLARLNTAFVHHYDRREYDEVLAMFTPDSGDGGRRPSSGSVCQTMACYPVQRQCFLPHRAGLFVLVDGEMRVAESVTSRPAASRWWR
jgi:hypothetical protein